jgi:hypothetical protein
MEEEEPAETLNIAEAFEVSEVRADRFAVYIPEQDSDGNSIGLSVQEDWINRVLGLFTEINGGATAMPPIRGAWLNRETGTVVIERPILVYTYIDLIPFKSRITEINQLLREMGEATGQKEVAIEFNQTFYLIKVA